ncbi:hypothetical protein BGX23_011883 [Mortierella sp. AD031]|nr:hypothetical protein BGX23_011883 [Mortierella sp. AD031]
MALPETLNLDCITSDPGSKYLFGIASVNQEDNLGSYALADTYAVLVKSNYNPTNLTNLTWNIVSHIGSELFSYGYPRFTTVDCAAHDKGHFAFFFRGRTYRSISPTDLIPMGVRYDSIRDRWYRIQGSMQYGWTSNSFVHKSFYSGGDLIHLYTDSSFVNVALGLLDHTTNVLQLASLQKRGGDRGNSFITSRTMDGVTINADFDYTLQGFFPEYFGTSNRGPSKPIGHHHLFAGRRGNSIFFGGIFKENGYKIYTTEEREGGTYIEHIFNWNDTKTEFSVHGSFPTVGGLEKGQEPFAVALTSAGLFEFKIFGPNAGAMAGPFKVKAEGMFLSLPQRVNTPSNSMWVSGGGFGLSYQAERDRITGGIIAAVVVVAMAIGFLFWRRRRERRRIRDREKEKEMESQKPPTYSEKHEVLSDGLIPELESLTAESVSIRPRLDARAHSHTYQDQINDLQFSSHPRPSIVTTVGGV